MYRIIQIYYDDDTLKNCYDNGNVEKYFNKCVDDFFENSVICNFIDRALDFDYFGVWSHKHRFKVQGHKFDFGELECRLRGTDILAFQRFMRNGRIFSGEREQKYKKMFNRIMELLKLRYRFPFSPKFVIMQNHFIARSGIFVDYVQTVLRPAIAIMNEMPETAEVIKYDGPGRYTYRPFLCEKLMSAYLFDKRYKCEQW